MNTESSSETESGNEIAANTVLVDPIEEVSHRLIDFLGLWFKAAGPKVATGVVVRWDLVGELQGTWVLNLKKGSIGFEPTSPANYRCDAYIAWGLTFRDAADFVQGKYSMREAMQDGRLVVTASRTNMQKLSRSVAAASKTSLVALLHDTEARVELGFAALGEPATRA